jgi:hypothetical protein
MKSGGTNRGKDVATFAHATALMPPDFAGCFASAIVAARFRSSSFLKFIQLRPVFTLPSFAAFCSTR